MDRWKQSRKIKLCESMGSTSSKNTQNRYTQTIPPFPNLCTHQMIIRHRAHSAEIIQVVLERRVVPMPRHHSERRRRQGRFEQLARELVSHPVRPLNVFVGGDGVLKVARVRETVGAKGTKLRELCLG